MMILLTVAGLFLFAAVTAASGAEGIPITVENTGRTAAPAAPVSVGVPFARGALKDPSALSLAAADGKAVPAQTACLSKWPDGSCRWVLVDFQADVPAGATAGFSLSASGRPTAPADPVTVREKGPAVTLSNGLVEFAVKTGSPGGTLKSADGKASAEIVSLVEIGEREKRITSKTIIDSIEVYARGPLRAAVSIHGRRLYSDGQEGPFSQRVEMFAASPYLRVEDTFVYAHLPGTNAEPQNPLALWQVEARPEGDATRLDVESLVCPEEAEGLVVSETSVAFWGGDKPFDLSRHTDEDLPGEDCPGIALGLGKSCAAAVGLLPAGGEKKAQARPVPDVWGHTTPEVYAASGVLGDFAPETAGKFDQVEEGMRQILGFWLWAQDNDPKGSFDKGPWHGIFDWGDWQSRYADRRHRPTGWNYLEGRYGWDCNEMDTTLTLWSAFYHTGRPEYWRAAVAMSRHVMDVDMINVDYRKWDVPEYAYDHHTYYRGATWSEGYDRLKDINTIGLGRRHNVQHWGNGVGDTRHTWNGGVMMYYYMTGNRRAYDAARAMADMHVQRIFGCAAGEYALGLWCIYNAWQMTGEQEYLDEFNYRLKMTHKFQRPGGGIAGHIDFQKGAIYPGMEGENGAYLDLTLDYISNALIDYHADTADKTAREVLMRLAERFIKDNPRSPADFQRTDGLRILAWAYRQTGEKRYLERARFHMSSLAAKPLEKQPQSPEEWVKAVFDLLNPHDWDIRVVGPAVRMAPYVMHAINGKQ